VIVMPGRPGRYTSHRDSDPVLICGYCGSYDCGLIGRGPHHWVES